MQLTSSLPQELANHVFLIPGDISTLRLPSERFGSILASRILHLLEPDKVEKTVASIFNALKPGGQAFVLCSTPYMAASETFIPIFEEKKAAGDLWPGFTKNIKDHYKGNLTGWQDVTFPENMNYMDPDILKRVFEKAGFEIISCDFQKKTAPLPEALKYDGREFVSLIARKPN